MKLRVVFAAWWPLAASWLLMGLELPLVSAVIARLPDPETQLAAFGGIMFPIAFIIEAPIIMLLSASTALSSNLDAYRRVRRFMIAAASGLGALHLAVAVTPLFDLVVGRWIGAPPELHEPARLGLLLMTPWTPAIAYRRFQQGVLIRFGRSGVVGIGTCVRLAANAAALAIGALLGAGTGVVVAAVAIVAGVVAEAVFIGAAVRPVVRGALSAAAPAPGAPPLDARRFLEFYTPLAVTPLLFHLAMPIATAAMSRMPRAIDSLAVWPVVNGLVFLLRGLGFAFNEVVVALLDRPGAARALSRFAWILGLSTSGLLVLLASTPLASIWFRDVSGLAPPLAALASHAVWLAVLMPALSAAQNWFQGNLVHGRATRAVTEAVVGSVLASTALLAAGVARSDFPGVYAAIGAGFCGALVQTAWLRHRSRAIRHGTGGCEPVTLGPS